MSDDEHKDFSEQQVQERFEAIGKRMLEAGLYAEAVEAYKELLRDFPASRWAANAYMAMARCYHAMGQEEDELRTLEDVIAQFPDHIVAKRARGAIDALRARHSSETPAGTDLHAAVRRLTRQVERMREGQRHRAWLGAVMYVLLVAVVVWSAARPHGAGSPQGAGDLARRVAAVETQIQALSAQPGVSSSQPAPAANAGSRTTGIPSRPAPSVTVIPIEPPTAKPAPPQKPAAGAVREPPTPPAPGKATAAKPLSVKPIAPKPTVAKPTPAKPSPVKPTAKPVAVKPALKPKPPVKPVAAKPKPAPTKPKPAPAVASTRAYMVKEGDSAWAIAKRELGDARRADEIMQLNGLKPPYKLRTGEKIRLPARR